MTDQDTAAIREANDRFRKGDPSIPGQWVMTHGIAAILVTHGQSPLDIIEIVQAFDTFTPDNDPHREHEFGSFKFGGETCFWKVDLYDAELRYGSPDPTDLSKTKRVMTIMLASEY